ncbi:hypothetical protein TEA_029292 [Camellia sinensis var. sinensis]|uniref:nucleoside-diphosphate kinase n=1 Tax=Camellia sinensis var. sinensis TaxID=542762 RepID=A0A4S4EQB3_CAMSN|nr:hypothetical protein TEA_029292 [Camellia sinensis var. sinensis]
MSGALALPAAAYMLQEQEAHAAEMEHTFIAIKPDGVQRGLIAEIISRFERKGFKLVAIKIVVPSKAFAQKHYPDLKERPFFNGLCNFLSSGPVIAMVWEGEGVITYGRKLIGATDPQKSEISHGRDWTFWWRRRKWWKGQSLKRLMRQLQNAWENLNTQNDNSRRRRKWWKGQSLKRLMRQLQNAWENLNTQNDNSSIVVREGEREKREGGGGRRLRARHRSSSPRRRPSQQSDRRPIQLVVVAAPPSPQLHRCRLRLLLLLFPH